MLSQKYAEESPFQCLCRHPHSVPRQEARHFLLRASEEEPTNPRVWVQLFDAESALGHPVDALQYLWRAAELSDSVHRMFEVVTYPSPSLEDTTVPTT